jgi:RNA polymerase sigma-70 factor (sigma-E family)
MVARVERRVSVADDLPAPPGDFVDLYQRLWWPMLRVAAALVDDRGSAEDVVQDAFAGLYRRWADMRDPAAAAGYLRTSVVNGGRSLLRKRRTARKHLRVAGDESDQPADAGVLLSAEHRMVRDALAQLPARQREVLTLRYIAELSDADIARATGLSQPGVRSASSRGLATLRSELGGVL